MGTAAASAGSVGWALPVSGKTGTTESHRSSGFLGYTNQLAAASYVFDDSPQPGGLCSYPLRKCGGAGNLYGGTAPAQTWFLAMSPLANSFGPVTMPPTDPRYVNGAPGTAVPDVMGLNLDAAKKRISDAGFQVATVPTAIFSLAAKDTVVGTTPAGQVLPGSIITINTSNGIAPGPPPPPAQPVRSVDRLFRHVSPIRDRPPPSSTSDAGR